jgi:hypothetical protein
MSSFTAITDDQPLRQIGRRRRVMPYVLTMIGALLILSAPNLVAMWMWSGLQEGAKDPAFLGTMTSESRAAVNRAVAHGGWSMLIAGLASSVGAGLGLTLVFAGQRLLRRGPFM